MKIIPLKKNPDAYTCQSYYITGDWKYHEDVNTLIDIGADNYVAEEILAAPKGIGSQHLHQIIITHEHYDHAGGLVNLKNLFNAKVFAFSNQLKNVDVRLKDKQKLTVGDAEAIILHTPGHSDDSISVYIEQHGIIFTGDLPLEIKTAGGNYKKEFVHVLEHLLKLNLKTIYSGHNIPMEKNIERTLETTLDCVLKSNIV